MGYEFECLGSVREEVLNPGTGVSEGESQLRQFADQDVVCNLFIVSDNSERAIPGLISSSM